MSQIATRILITKPEVYYNTQFFVEVGWIFSMQGDHRGINFLEGPLKSLGQRYYCYFAKF